MNFGARKNRLIKRGDVLTGFELTGTYCIWWIGIWTFCPQEPKHSNLTNSFLTYHPNLKFILTIKLVYTYFSQTLPEGALILVAMFRSLLQPLTAQSPQITEKGTTDKYLYIYPGVVLLFASSVYILSPFFKGLVKTRAEKGWVTGAPPPCKTWKDRTVRKHLMFENIVNNNTLICAPNLCFSGQHPCVRCLERIPGATQSNDPGISKSPWHDGNLNCTCFGVGCACFLTWHINNKTTASSLIQHSKVSQHEGWGWGGADMFREGLVKHSNIMFQAEGNALSSGPTPTLTKDGGLCWLKPVSEIRKHMLSQQVWQGGGVGGDNASSEACFLAGTCSFCHFCHC